MAEAPREVTDLVLRWQELQARGEAPDVKVLCADRPDLAAEVERRVRVLQAAAVMGIGAEGATLAPNDGALTRPHGAPGYEVLGELGRGGMGVVYKARHVSLNRVVALKMILAGSHAGAGDIERFLSEAEAVAAFSHPHVVQVYEVGQDRRCPYMALEFIDGGNLADRLKDGPLPPRDAARIVEQLAHGLNAAHQAGIVHRDLKPANVLLTKDGTPKITDFGLAKRVQSTDGPTQTGAILGTPSYMAPEQAAGQGKRVGPACDIYALGAILYECLTGRPPFRGASAWQTVSQVISDEPVPPKQINPKAPRDLATIALKCLHKEPGKRYGSAQALAEDLRRYLADEPIQARRVGAAGRLARWARRNPLVTTLAVGVGLALGIGLTLAGWQWHQTSRARADLDHSLYLANLALAERERQAGNPHLSRELLLRCPPELRGWEWDCLWRLRDAPPRRFDDHQAPVLCAAVHPGRRLLASAGDDGFIRVRDADTGSLLFRLPLDEGEQVYALSFHPDGERLAGASQHRMAKVWDLTSRRVVRRLRHQDVVVFTAFSPDGKHLASCSDDGTIKLWDADEGEEAAATLAGHKGFVNAVAFSPDGQYLLSGGEEGTIRVWAVPSGKPVATGEGHRGFVWTVGWHPGGRLLASAGEDHIVRLWTFDPRRGLLEQTQTLSGHSGTIWNLAFSPDGERLVSGGMDRTVRVWGRRGSAWIEYLALGGHRDSVNNLRFDGERLISASDDHSLVIWNEAQSASPAPMTAFDPGGIVRAVAFAPGGRLLASTGSDNQVRLWDIRKGKEEVAVLHGHRTTGTCLAFSGDGLWLLSGSSDKTARVWEVASFREVRVYSEHIDRLTAVAFHPDGKRAASASWDGTARLWDWRSGKTLRVFAGHRGWVQGLAFSPDGKQLVTTGYDSTVRLHDVETGKPGPLLPGHQYRVFSAAFHPKGHLLATGAGDGRVRTWSRPFTATPGNLLEGHTKRVYQVAFSPDGLLLASAGEDRTVRVWGAKEPWPLVEVFRGHAGAVTSLAFTSDSKLLATGSDDGKVRVWPVPAVTP